jgi:hypothetical protein
MREVVFKSELLQDGHLACPKKYAKPWAQFKVIVSLPGDDKVPPPRPFGLSKGTFRVPDDFDAPLPEDTIKAFEGYEIFD